MPGSFRVEIYQTNNPKETKIAERTFTKGPNNLSISAHHLRGQMPNSVSKDSQDGTSRVHCSWEASESAKKFFFRNEFE